MKNFLVLLLLCFSFLQGNSQSFVNPIHVTSGYYLESASRDTFNSGLSSWGKSDSLQLLYNADSTIHARYYLIDDPDSGWVVNFYDAYFYDELKRDTSHVYVQWDPFNSVWQNVSKEFKVYDANDNVLSVSIYNWDTSGFWANSNLILNSYNVANKLLKTTFAGWNSATLQWDSSQQFVYTYNGSNQRLTETDYSWDGSSWQKVNKYLYAYDASGNDTIMVAQFWTGSNWKNNYRDSLEYDANNNLIRLTRLDWDIATTSFLFTDAKSEYTFTGNQLTERTDYNGDGTSFNPSLQYDYTYDGNANNSHLILKLYNQSTSQFENYDQYFYYYTNVITGEQQLAVSSGQLAVYPNPASNQLTVYSEQLAGNSISILDISGKEIFYKKTNLKSETINLKSFTAGIYFIRVVNPKTQAVSVNKFIKQ